VGSKVTGYEKGDHVAVRPIINCGDCEPCKSGRYQFCLSGSSIGRDLDGGFAEYVSVPSRNMRRVDENLPLDIVSLADSLAVAIHCLNVGNMEIGNARVGIIGDGAIGLCCAYTALNLGYPEVTVFGRHQDNLRIAQNLGAKTKLVNPQTQSYGKERSFDMIIETVGRRQSDTIRQSVRMIDIGGKIVVAGVFDHGFEGYYVFRDLGWKEASLVGANSYCMYRGEDEFDIALRMIRETPADLGGLITQRYPLSQMDKAIDLMVNKRHDPVVKIIIKPGEKE